MNDVHTWCIIKINSKRGLSMLSSDQLAQYEDDGFLVVHNVLDKNDLQPVVNYCEALTSALAEELFARERINCLHQELDFKYRLSKLEQEYPGAGVMVTLRNKMSLEIFRLWTNEKLLNIIECLLGPDFDGHPFWALRAKTPNQNLLEVPWHQDCAYLSENAHSTFQPTLWIPLVDATSENGCMQFARGLQKLETEFVHTPQKKLSDNASWYLEMDHSVLSDTDIISCEVPVGSIIISNQLIPHRSLPNVSSETRWSIDFRYQKPGMFSGTNKKPLLMRRHLRAESLNVKKAHDLFVSTDVSSLDDEQFHMAHRGHPWLERWGV